VPEGDTVWLTARRLHEALAGQVLTRSDFRVPRYATADLSGQQVTEALARGKHLLIRTGNGLTIHTHLKMDGFWRVSPASARLTESYKIRLILANDRWQAAGYLLGITEVLPTAGRLARDADKPIGEALLDQRNLAGIGNVYKSELLFLRGVSPWLPVGDVKDLNRMADLARRLLDANKARSGHITTGDTTPGRQHWVYGRGGSPCRRCGTLIRKRADGGDRITFWCPACQPG
jgi:endonuclease-8